METCQSCSKEYQPGKNGTLVPRQCDECQGICRDSRGYTWKPGETERIEAPIETAWDETTWRKVKRNDV